MKEIILHVGHGKTGSSYLQSVFSLNEILFRKFDIEYPVHSTHVLASQGKTTSGNGPTLRRSTLENSTSNTILFSSEMLFRQLLRNEVLKEIAANYNVKVVIFTRDIVEHAISRWAQDVKRGGVTENINTYLMANPVGPHPLILDWIEKSKIWDFRLVIRNYSVCKEEIVPIFFEDGLGIGPDNIQIRNPPLKIINRSLTLSEYDIQRLFNSIYGFRSQVAISDYLVNEFPRTPPIQLKVKRETYDKIRQLHEPILPAINEFMPTEEPLRIGEREYFCSEEPAPFLEADLLQGLSKSIQSTLLQKELAQNHIESIRDVALTIANGGNLVLEDALNLMKCAQVLRPNGPLINAKIAEWSKKLNRE